MRDRREERRGEKGLGWLVWATEGDEEERRREEEGESAAEPREKEEKREKRKEKWKREGSGTRVVCVWFHKKIMLSSSNKSCADTWQWKITFYFKAQTFINYIRTPLY